MENIKLALKLFISSDEFNNYNKSIQYLCLSLLYLISETSSDMLRSKNSQVPTKEKHI